MPTPLLVLENLCVRFDAANRGEATEVLRDVSLELNAAEAVALVGPSGSGKSLTARAICGLLPAGAERFGSIRWQGIDLLESPVDSWAGLRGRAMTLVLQEPQSSLNPVLRIGRQIAESVQLHKRCGRGEAERIAIALLKEVQLPNPEQQFAAWPHELSGGMRQRALLAAALACNPRLLICDEPTTALDPTVQREILALLDRIRRDRDMALLFITHDLDLARLMTDRSIRLEGGRVVDDPSEASLATAEPTRKQSPTIEIAAPVLHAKGLQYTYDRGTRQREHQALVEFDLSLTAGRIVGLAGESGCGKSTAARLLTGHLRLQQGVIHLGDQSHSADNGPLPAEVRRRIQMIFQDPGQSLNPRQKIGNLLTEAAGTGAKDPVAMLSEVQLTPELLNRYPHELSGGQKQRVALARALACDPEVVVADEITSSLDGTTRARILELLRNLVVDRNRALLLIDHDLDTLQTFCDEVLVMYAGVVMEVFRPGPDREPVHPYTRNLLSASPRELGRDPQGWQSVTGRRNKERQKGDSGCPWKHACSIRNEICDKELPVLKDRGKDTCHRCPRVER